MRRHKGHENLLVEAAAVREARLSKWAGDQTTLFSPQGLDRFEAGGLARRIESGDHACKRKAGNGKDRRLGHESRRIEAAGTVVIAKQRHEPAGQTHADSPLTSVRIIPSAKKCSMMLRLV